MWSDLLCTSLASHECIGNRGNNLTNSVAKKGEANVCKNQSVVENQREKTKKEQYMKKDGLIVPRMEINSTIYLSELQLRNVGGGMSQI